MKTDNNLEQAAPEGLVDVHGLIKAIWKDPATAPCARTIERLREAGKIPYVRLGRLIWYSPSAVMEAIQQKHTIQPRGLRNRM